MFSWKLEALPKEHVVWHWEDDFSETEKEKLQNWLYTVLETCEKSIAPFPFKLHFHMHRMENKGEPVPWANTWKFPNQAVHFHVDPNYALQDFLNDWTAPHEISHLALPYLGEDLAWFAEGFASFMQCRIMRDMKIYSHEGMHEHFESKWKMLAPHLNSTKSMSQLCMQMREERNYPGMYWGGASFFYLLNQELERQGRSFEWLLGKYLNCCRSNGRNIKDVLSSWDKILGSNTCANSYEEFQSKSASSIKRRLNL